MTGILEIIILAIFFSSLFVISEKYNPLTLFCGFWLVIIFLNKLELYNIERVDDEVLLVVLTGVLSYAFGCMIASQWGKKKATQKVFDHSEKKHAINYRILYFTTITISIVMMMYFARVAILILRGNSLDFIRTNFSNLVISNEIERLTWTFIIYPLSLSIMPMGLYAFFIDRKPAGYLGASLLNTILLSICTGGRVFLVYYVIQFAFFSSLSQKRVNFKTRIQRNLVLVTVAAFCVGVMVYISNQRQIEYTPLEALYLYYTGCLQYFYYKLQEVHYISYGYGFYFLYSPILLGVMILKNLGFVSYSSGFLAAQETINSLQEYTKVGNSMFNAFSTCFYFFYVDGGYLGVILESFLYGFLSYSIFNSLRRQAQPRYVILYGIILITIFTSMIRWQFARPELFLAAVYIVLLTIDKKTREATDASST